MEQIPLEAVLRLPEDREVIQDKGTSCLTSPVSFPDGVTPSVDTESAVDVIYLQSCKALGTPSPQHSL